ncbi:EamA family transporter [Paraclostridium ghonii]|uniref:Drug/metabolite transporter (DMT)-like permease n=1 Tax=Paraclostridium ghonii TaxID=29358 RepID=A0ABU0MXS9_9FIRM|nr:DMT family transporter [Paeniclostridium ghonii]MDQ0555700.1 drug/metabolite transporter (DMT)-like permease [Paeniclostridium ghonii]
MKTNNKGVVYIVIATLGFSIIPILANMGLENNLSSATLLFYRFFIAGVVFLAYCVITKRKICLKDKKEALYICVAGVIYSVQCISFFSSFQYISPSIGEIIYHCYPLFTLILASLILKEGVTKKKVIGVILSVVGTSIVLYAPWQMAEIRGIMYVIMAALVSAIYMVYTKKRITNMDTIVLTMYLCFVCCAIYFLYSMVNGEFVFISNPKIIFYVSILALFSTIVGFFAFMKAISLLSVGKVSILSLFEPIFTILLDYIILGTKLTILQIIGTAVILLAIYIYDRPCKDDLLAEV